MKIKPNTFYSSEATLETFYVNKHGVCFLIDAAQDDWPEGYTHERVHKLPTDAREENPVTVAMSGITIPYAIEDVK